MDWELNVRSHLYSKQPLDDLWPQICWGHMCSSIQGLLCRTTIKIQSMWIQWPFFKNFNQRSLTLHDLWPTSIEVTYVTSPKDHCVQVPWEYIHIQNEWLHGLFLNQVQARQKVQSHHHFPQIPKNMGRALLTISVQSIQSNDKRGEKDIHVRFVPAIV